MPQLVWTADPAGTVTYVNRQWIEYTGCTAEQLAASDGAVGIVHPSDVEPDLGPLERRFGRDHDL